MTGKYSLVFEGDVQPYWKWYVETFRILSINLSLSSFEQRYKVCVEFSIQTSPQRYQNIPKILCEYARKNYQLSHFIPLSAHETLFASWMVVWWTFPFIFTKSFVWK